MKRTFTASIRGGALLVGLWLLLFAAPASAAVEMTDLGHLGYEWSTANDISNAGHVVGVSGNTTGEWDAFIWQDGVMSALNELIPSEPKWELTSAVGINEAGQIVGRAKVGRGKRASYRGYLLTPN